MTYNVVMLFEGGHRHIAFDARDKVEARAVIKDQSKKYPHAWFQWMPSDPGRRIASD